MSKTSQPAPAPFITGAEHAGTEEAPDPLVGQLLDSRYRVLERLAEGGMGTVYRAEHIGLCKEVAIKLVQDVGNSDHAMRFLREAMLTSRIDHPNVISAIDYGTFQQGSPYLVMHLVDGPTLAHVMRSDYPMPWTRAAEIGAQMADAIAAAQAQGIVHRDLKPENIVLQPTMDGSDAVKVLDFGIAKYARDSLAPPSVRGAQHVTRLGMVVGTPGYMAPEQAVGVRTDHRADLYSIGVMLWECVVGRRLWECSDLQELLTAQLGTCPPLVRAESGDPWIPEAFEALIASLLATRPEDRPQSAAETRDRLRAILDAERQESQPRVHLPPGAQPTPTFVAPPPPTSTVFIDVALARWRGQAGAGEPDAQAHFAQDTQPATRVYAPPDAAGEAVEAHPTTVVGFRAPVRITEALRHGASSQAAEEAAVGTAIASAPAPATAGEPAHSGASAARVPLRVYIALPLAVAALSGLLWLALAAESSTALSSAPERTHATPSSERRAPLGAPALAKRPHAPMRPATNVPAPAPAPTSAVLSAAATNASSQSAVDAPAPSKHDGPATLARTSSEREPASALRAKARTYFRHAQFERAAQIYGLAIKAAPRYAGSYAGLGACQLALGDTKGAIASYVQAIRRSPATSGFHAALGRAYFIAGDRARALAEYRKALALDPANEIAASALARLTR